MVDALVAAGKDFDFFAPQPQPAYMEQHKASLFNMMLDFVRENCNALDSPENSNPMTDSTTVPSGHPKGLYTLFFSEMWERFCYYGMRVLLTLFLVKSLLKGDAEASLIYGAYTALIYAAPVLGGRWRTSTSGTDTLSSWVPS